MVELVFVSVVLTSICALAGCVSGILGRVVICILKKFGFGELEGLVYDLTLLTLLISMLVITAYSAISTFSPRNATFLGETFAVLMLLIIFYPGFYLCHLVMKKSKTHQITKFEKLWF